MPKECIKLTEKPSKISLLIKYFSEHGDPDVDSDQPSHFVRRSEKLFLWDYLQYTYYRYIQIEKDITLT